MKRKKTPHHGKSRKTIPVEPYPSKSDNREETKKLKIVLKCDSVGSEEAVISILTPEQDNQGEIQVIQTGVGTITKSDLLMALSGSRLVVGFNTDIMPNLQQVCREQASNHLKLRWSKARVVSVKEKSRQKTVAGMNREVHVRFCGSVGGEIPPRHPTPHFTILQPYKT